MYIRHALHSACGLDRGQIDLLVQMAGNSFVQATLSCHYVMAKTTIPSKPAHRRRLKQVLSSNGTMRSLFALAIRSFTHDGNPEALLQYLVLLGGIDEAALGVMCGSLSYSVDDEAILKLLPSLRSDTSLLRYIESGPKTTTCELCRFFSIRAGLNDTTKSMDIVLTELLRLLNICRDIEYALSDNPLTSVTKNPPVLREADVRDYIHFTLNHIGADEAELDLLATFAGTSSVWAATSCRFVLGEPNASEASVKLRLARMLQCNPDLESLYSAILDEACSQAATDEKVMWLVLGLMLRPRAEIDSLPLTGYLQRVPKLVLPRQLDDGMLRRSVAPLYAVLKGVDNPKEIVPWDNTFALYLCGRDEINHTWQNCSLLIVSFDLLLFLSETDVSPD